MEHLCGVRTSKRRLSPQMHQLGAPARKERGQGHLSPLFRQCPLAKNQELFSQSLAH